MPTRSNKWSASLSARSNKCGLDREDLQPFHVDAAYGAYTNVEYRKRHRPTELDDELWTKVRKTVFKELPRFESQRARHTGSTLRQKGAV